LTGSGSLEALASTHARLLDGDAIGEAPDDPAGWPAAPRVVERIDAKRVPEMVAIREEKPSGMTPTTVCGTPPIQSAFR
jgi:hypothetical protein